MMTFLAGLTIGLLLGLFIAGALCLARQGGSDA